jgi:hypothetical protein
MRDVLRWVLSTTFALGSTAACSAASADPSSPDPAGCFLAFNPQFDGFRSWTAFHYDGGDDGAGVHVSGPRVEYIEQAPPHGSASFPVGTLIVKEVGIDDPANHHLFAMVKRGCGFNAGGATGWEWMELDEAPPGATIRWRGGAPPAGETYAGAPAGCNSCHAACTDNDSVCSAYIRLSNF